jgi:hypothetical protein
MLASIVVAGAFGGWLFARKSARAVASAERLASETASAGRTVSCRERCVCLTAADFNAGGAKLWSDDELTDLSGRLPTGLVELRRSTFQEHESRDAGMRNHSRSGGLQAPPS